MERRILAFHQDPERDWVATLECGHTQHLRHDPPWQVRPWVLDASERNMRVGTLLDCRLCDSTPVRDDATGASASSRYDDARMQGLCADGAAEIARRRPRKP